MKLPSKKKIGITVFTIAALGLLTVVGVLVAVGITHRPKVTISVDDLAEMKTLVHKYLNERNRVAVSNDPENHPKIAGAPVIDPSEMSPELAARQAEDVEKLRARGRFERSDDFATFTEVLDIRKEDDDVLLVIGDTTYYNNILETETVLKANPSIRYAVDGGERYFTFAWKGNRWILADVKLTFVGGNQYCEQAPSNEPSDEVYEKGSSRVIENPEPPGDTTKIPEEVERLDEAATRKITNKWAIDKKTMAAIETVMGQNSHILGRIVQYD